MADGLRPSPWCPVCGDLLLNVIRHQCPPRWEVEINYARDTANPKWEEATRRVFGHDAESALEKWAERRDADGDYTIVRGSPLHVRVRRDGTDEPWRIFTITGEYTAEYTAEEETKP